MVRTVDTRFFLTHCIAESEQVRAKTSRKMVELQKEIVIGKDVAYLRVSLCW